jgi:hypothetical protein
MLREIQNYKEISIISYNKLKHTTRGFLLDNKTEKEILV